MDSAQLTLLGLTVIMIITACLSAYWVKPDYK